MIDLKMVIMYYLLKVQVAYKRPCDSKPSAILVVRVTTGAAAANVKKEGLDDMAKYFKHQLFLVGFCHNIREKVLEAKKDDTYFKSLDLAGELEAIQQNHCHSQKIAALKVKMPPEEAKMVNWEELTE
jgi:hypothetical protein